MLHPTTNSDVIVIGAGLSGLETALTLEEVGLTVTVLEGRRRIGGRLYTLDHVPGKPEVGGNIVSRAYGRVIAASSRYGVPLRDDAPRYAAFPDRQVTFIGGRAIDAATWAQHPANPFVGEERSLLPAAWGRTVLNRYRPFDDLENWHQPQHADLDISVHDFLRSRGATPAAIRLGYETNMPYGTESSHDVSILQLAFVDHWQRINQRQLGAGDRFVGVFEGGTQQLPIAMAKRLPNNAGVGSHWVVYAFQDSIGCAGVDSQLTNVLAPPSPAQAGPDLQGESSVQLQAVPPTSGTGQWLLNGFPGTLSDSLNPTASAISDQSGTFVLVWSVSNPPCPAEFDSVLVLLQGLHIPTGFSPTGDGVNDIYFVRGLGSYPGTRMQVLNRWGQSLIEFDDYQNNWDGRGRDMQPLVEDTYYIVLEYGDKQVGTYVVLKR